MRLKSASNSLSSLLPSVSFAPNAAAAARQSAGVK